jgi:GntR family transcriptional regulator
MQLKYHSVFKDIQHKIISGFWPEDTMIPTEFELCEIHGVSRITVRRALDELVQMGLVRRSRGKGSFVCATKRFAEYRNGLLSQDGIKFDTNVTNRILEIIHYAPDTELAQRMGAVLKVENTAIKRFRLLRLVDNLPYALMSIFTPDALGAKVAELDLVNHSFLDLYEQVTGKKITSLQRTVSAIIPDDDICALLGVKPGTAHLWMKNIAYLVDETPVAVNYAVYNGNLFDFAVNIDLDNPPKMLL